MGRRGLWTGKRLRAISRELARLGLGELKNGTGRPEEAMIEFELALRRKPALVAAHLGLGNALAVLGRNQEAFERYENALSLKPRLPDTQFLMVTVYEDANHIFNALSAGATGYLLKQMRRTELLDALKDVHAGGSPMSSQIARKVVQNFFRNDAPPGKNGEAVELSGREREVLELLAQGYAYKEIGDRLTLSTHTVNAHLRHIYEKLHVRSRAQAVARYTHSPATADPSAGLKG